MNIEKEKRVELTTILASGLLASGHFSLPADEEGEPSLKYAEESDDLLRSRVAQTASALLDEIILYEE